ncbi:hypothetical protein PMAYCL1PPCAC_25641, partial [Pristionchus mayeri]
KMGDLPKYVANLRKQIGDMFVGIFLRSNQHLIEMERERLEREKAEAKLEEARTFTNAEIERIAEEIRQQVGRDYER